MLRFIDTQTEWNGRDLIGGIRHPRNIEQLWTENQLAAIGLERYTPPPPPEPEPLTLPISRVRFKAVLRIHGLLDAVKAAIEAIPDDTARAIALTKFEDSDRYDRDDPLFAQLAPLLDLTGDQIDAMWLQAQGLDL